MFIHPQLAVVICSFTRTHQGVQDYVTPNKGQVKQAGERRITFPHISVSLPLSIGSPLTCASSIVGAGLRKGWRGLKKRDKLSGCNLSNGLQPTVEKPCCRTFCHFGHRHDSPSLQSSYGDER